MRRWVKWAALALALVLLGYAAFVSYVSWRSAESLIHPERERSDETPATFGLAYENVTFPTEDGLSLRGWWMPERGPGHNGTVVFLHGYGDSKAQALEVAPFLLNASYDVLAFDFRAHGESDGDATTVGLVEAEDVRAAIRHLQQRPDADADRIALLGFSMGAAAGLNAAVTLPEVDAIVSDSGFATLTNIASNSITHFTGLPKYPYGPLAVLFAGWMVGHDVGDNRPMDAARALHAPVLVIQGADDTITFPDDDGETLRAASAASGSVYWLVPGAKHVQAVRVAPDEYAERVVAFLGAHVAPGTAAAAAAG